MHSYCGNIFQFTTEKEGVFNVAVGALISPIIKKDATDLAEWTGKHVKRGLAFLRGVPYEDSSPIKQTKTVMADVIGVEQPKKVLSRIVDYFKSKSEHNRSGVCIERGYLLVGPLDTSKLLANAVAGEVTAHYKEKGKTTVCSVYEVHSSELITKELKTIIKEAGEKSPCIVILDDLDWLHAQPRVGAKVWSDIASTLNGVLKSKKQVFVIATVRDAKILSTHNKGQFGLVISVENASHEDRAEFFRREFVKRAIVPTRFDLQALAQATDSCSFSTLRAIINRGLSIAQAHKAVLTQEHLMQGIEETKNL